MTALEQAYTTLTNPPSTSLASSFCRTRLRYSQNRRCYYRTRPLYSQTRGRKNTTHSRESGYYTPGKRRQQPLNDVHLLVLCI